jgi:hypothetical protein
MKKDYSTLLISAFVIGIACKSGASAETLLAVTLEPKVWQY